MRCKSSFVRYKSSENKCAFVCSINRYDLCDASIRPHFYGYSIYIYTWRGRLVATSTKRYCAFQWHMQKSLQNDGFAYVKYNHNHSNRPIHLQLQSNILDLPANDTCPNAISEIELVMELNDLRTVIMCEFV